MAVNTNETVLLKTLAPFIIRTAKRFFPKSPSVREDAIQEGRMAAIRAARKWREDSGAKLITHCMRNIRWGIAMFADSEFKKQHVHECRVTVEMPDPAAIDAEQAVIVQELFDSLLPAQQEEIVRRYHDSVFGRPTKLYQATVRSVSRRLNS